MIFIQKRAAFDRKAALFYLISGILYKFDKESNERWMKQIKHMKYSCSRTAQTLMKIVWIFHMTIKRQVKHI
ncbi:hypothetical protein SAMN05660841_02463 [Sphingobacterium nematocida]|uniref:Uncharacterized protein n=1 Tax=Sphingobacterium nematocida TaxID=1513896 RepID=A0A1T5EAK8_9SPHI|nr:hypothetical protein SAMN05660841_02463 [Sphingobacterium nematocida]